MRLVKGVLILMEQKTILNDVPFHISKKIASQLLKAKKKVVEDDQDRVYVVTGREGLGKSTLAMQLGYFLDRELDLKNIVFDANSFEKRIREVSKHKVIIFDECFNGLSSKGSLSKENKHLLRLLQECRQRNLFIFLVLPSFFLLEKYAAVFRSHCVFNVIGHKKNFKLRSYKVYNYIQKKILYVRGKPLMDYSKPFIREKHRFFKKLPPTIDDSAYRRKKLAAFKDSGRKDIVPNRYQLQRDHLIKHLCSKEGYLQRDIVEMFSECPVPLRKSYISEIFRERSSISP